MVKIIEETVKKDNYGLLGSTILYGVLAVVFIILGSYVQSKSFHIGIFVTEYFIVFMPVILFGLATKVDLKKALRLNPIKLRTVPKIFFLSLTLLPVIAASNMLVITILSFFGKALVLPIPDATNTREFLIMFFLVAISAGLCEEMMFRGMILSAFEGHFNKKWGTVAAALLFGLFHFNIQNLFGPIILGLVFGYLVQGTNSILSSILAHTFNNGIAVVLSYIATKSVTLSNATQASPEELFNTPSIMIVQTLFFIALAIGSGFIAFLIVRSIINDYRGVNINDQMIINKKKYVVTGFDDNIAILTLREEINAPEKNLKSLKLDNPAIKSFNRTLNIWNDRMRNKPQIKYFIPIGISVIIYFVLLKIQLS